MLSIQRRWLLVGVVGVFVSGVVVAQERGSQEEFRILHGAGAGRPVERGSQDESRILHGNPSQEPRSAAESPSSTDNPAAEEKTYLDLRRSKDHTTRRFAERYFSLIRTQEWTSLKGSSKITAKYVSHDPEMKWVKLATVKGSGANRAVREITVDLAKLSKTCQSRVKQIDTLQKKLDELAAAAGEEETDDAEGAGSTDGEYGGYGGSGERMNRERGERAEPAVDERGEGGQPGDAESAGDDQVQTGEYGEYGGYQPEGAPRTPTADATQQGPLADSSDPDPLGFGDVANETPQVATPPVPGSTPLPYGPYSTGPSTESEPAQPGSAAGAGAVDRSEWETNFAAFHANFAVARDERGDAAIDWGELGELRAMNDAAGANLRDGEPIDPYRNQVSEIAQRLPEVNWTSEFLGLEQPKKGPAEARFDLPKLPEPLTIRFVVQPESVRTWAQMPPGQQVRFTGRFDIVQPNEIIIHLGMAEAIGARPTPIGPPPRR